jgi:hypothetical protein
MRRIYLTTLTVAYTAFLQIPADAQKLDDPNIGHFYMGRQQVTITNDAPIVNDQRTNSSGAAPGGMNGALGGRAPLPAAGWQSYSPVSPGLSTNLPKVNNGVPKPPPPAAAKKPPHGLTGNAGALGAGKGKSPTPPGDPNVVKMYKPYTRYQNPDSAGVSASDNANQQSSSNVRGSVLHWARGKK